MLACNQFFLGSPATTEPNFVGAPSFILWLAAFGLNPNVASSPGHPLDARARAAKTVAFRDAFELAQLNV